jgi:hypothetical protein
MELRTGALGGGRALRAPGAVLWAGKAGAVALCLAAPFLPMGQDARVVGAATTACAGAACAFLDPALGAVLVLAAMVLLVTGGSQHAERRRRRRWLRRKARAMAARRVLRDREETRRAAAAAAAAAAAVASDAVRRAAKTRTATAPRPHTVVIPDPAPAALSVVVIPDPAAPAAAAASVDGVGTGVMEGSWRGREAGGMGAEAGVDQRAFHERDVDVFGFVTQGALRSAQSNEVSPGALNRVYTPLGAGSYSAQGAMGGAPVGIGG